MKMYDVWFCKCGHIHIVPMDYMDWMAEDCQCRNVIRVCQHCGATYEMWLTDAFDGGHDINGKNPVDFEVFENANTRFIFNKGIEVPLVNGDYADYHCSTVWRCEDEKYKVDTTRFIEEVQRKYKDEAEDILKSISGYVSGIDWTDTPYDYKRKLKVE